ncbi:MAG: methionine--tRNA ligase [Eubacteriales bacterium]|nr:methionine--tRNA ligase [Eubacteriales bacterium]
MENKGKFYMTTAIAYASAKPHFGNTYEIILADALARYKRMCGYDVHFLTGTDEHGLKIENRAEQAGVTPKQYVDGVSGEIRSVWDLMGASYDRFIRTTDPDHEAAVAHIFQKLYDKGDIYKGTYEGWYCTPDEAFFTDSQIKEPGKCPDCGRPLVRASEEAYFFRMSAYADRLIAYINEHPGFIEPESRKKEMINNFLNAGLQDLCVTRTSFRWGIPAPVDPKHVIYVWVDALCNYITGIGYDPANIEQPELFKKNWPADIHIIGKDILRFHTIYWPIILMALDLPLPKKIFGHPWFNFGSDKMSKSLGNVIYADKLAEKIGADGVRYYALAEMPYASDGSITYESVIGRYNTDLANTLGNLVSRTLAMNEKYFGGVIQAPSSEEPVDAELASVCRDSAAKALKLADELHFADAIAAINEVFRRANKYIDETTPWVLAKSENTKARLGTVLYNLLEAIRIGAVLMLPYIPATAEKILDLLATDRRTFDDLSFGCLAPGGRTSVTTALFARIDEKQFLADFEEERQRQLAETADQANKEKKETAPAAPEKLPRIDYDTFMSVELRCAQVVECEKVAKSKKLLRFVMDLGYEKRQIVSGIAKFYQPEELIGRKLAIVANLEPVVLCGVESNGMILAAGEEDVRVLFLDDATPLGARIR